MNEFQQKWCLDLLNQLMSKNISNPFHREFSDTKLDIIYSAGNKENSIQQKPTQTLNYVSKKLKENKYKSPYEFGCDVNKVFAAGFYNFKQNTIIYNATLMLSEWFNKKIQHYPRTKEELWIDSLHKIQGQLEKLMQTIPNQGTSSSHLKSSEHKHHNKNKNKKPKKDPEELSDSS